MDKLAKFLQSKKFMVISGFVGLYLISAGLSWIVFSTVASEPSLDLTPGGLAGERSKIAELPKTEVCPINGGKFSEVERKIWESRRPATVILQNHPEARPLSGISKADVVYEAVAEGGVTRFLAVFYCGAAAHDLRVGVIRSARVYFIDWASEYGNKPLFLHWGGANNFCSDCPGGVKSRREVAPEVNAYALLDELGWRAGLEGNDFDGGYTVGYPIVVRDQSRLGVEEDQAEHTPVGFLDELYKAAAERGFGYKDGSGTAWDEDFVEWKFADDAPLGSPKASKISFEFWSNKPEFDVSWDYEPAGNRYLRNNGGEKFVDWEFDSVQVSAKNVVVMFVDERGPVDNEKHMFYETTGEGAAMYFMNGDVIQGSWEKPTQTSRTKFYDENGAEIEFVRGEIWIEAVPKGNDIEYN